MKLQQLKYLVAIADNNLSITEAAAKIYTSQPGISKQLKLLEEELNLKIFTRNGKTLSSITDAGKAVITKARKILAEVENIRRLSEDSFLAANGEFRIATTQTQASYVLPNVLSSFNKQYPQMVIDLQQGTTNLILDLLRKEQVDFAIASGNEPFSADMVSIPCYHWDRVLLFPQDHPLGDLKKITLADIAKYAIITYTFSDKGDSSLLNAFEAEKLNAKIAITARDADVIKTYVKSGMGVGIVASMAYDPKRDGDLISVSLKDILPRCTTWLAFSKNLLLRKHVYDFIELFAPHITRADIDEHLRSVGARQQEVREPVEALPMHASWSI